MMSTPDVAVPSGAFTPYIPGPVEVAAPVREALARPVVTPVDPTWGDSYRAAVEGTKTVLGCRGDVFLMCSSGTGAIEAIVGSIMRAGDDALVLVNGFFGSHLAHIARTLGIRVTELTAPLTDAISPDAVRQHLAHTRTRYAAVLAVHSESQTGVLNPVGELAAVAHEFGAPLVVDAVSSVGGAALTMDAWGIDFVAAATQKAFGGVVGVGIVAVGADAWRYVRREPRSLYFDLSIWRDAQSTRQGHPHPWSMGSGLIHSVTAACRIIESEGITQRWRRHAALSTAYRDGLRSLGVEPYCADDVASPTVVAMRAPDAMPYDAFIRRLREEFGLIVGVGIGELDNVVWRIGNMAAQATPERAGLLLDSAAQLLNAR